MSNKPVDKADAHAGIALVLIGLYFGVQSWMLPLGTTLRMGPGYFPLVLSGLLILLGLIVALQSIGREGQPIGRLAWRGALFILPAPVIFGLTVRGLGFVPAIFVATLIASRASVKMSWTASLVLTVAVTIFATLIFSYGLGLPYRRFGPWLPL